MVVTRCKITRYSLQNSLILVAEVARCKKSLVTRCKIRSLLAAEVACWKKSLVTRCKIPLLLVAKNNPLLVAEISRCKKSFVTLLKQSKLSEGFSFSICSNLFQNIKIFKVAPSQHITLKSASRTLSNTSVIESTLRAIWIEDSQWKQYICSQKRSS